ncbi:MAG: M17 family peptidase N-terminal domain-containing protein, partial [Verrucomicrobiota bacterium]
MAKKSDQRKSASKRRGNSSKRSPESKTEMAAAGGRTAFSINDAEIEDMLTAPDDHAMRAGEQSFRNLLIDYFGEEEYHELRALASQAKQLRAHPSHRVLILPGIMGSKLGKKRRFGLFEDTYWIDPIDAVLGNLSELNLRTGSGDIESLGVFLFAYLKMKLTLRARGFKAEFWHYDWRKSINESGEDLAKYLANLWDEGTEEVSLVAHSMGGMVSRMALLQLQKSRAQKSKNANKMVRQVIMLGTPNYGSFAPLFAYCGQNPVIDKIAALARKENLEFIRDIGTSFTGLCELMPFPERYNDVDFFDTEGGWEAVPAKPDDGLIESAKRIHDQFADYPWDKRFVMIAGVNQPTITEVRQAADGNGYEFLYTKNGDGTVPLDFADPRSPELEATYYVDAKHGDLANDSKVRAAVLSLLRNEEANNLLKDWTMSEESAVVRSAAVRSGRFVEDFTIREGRQLLEGFAAPSKPDRKTSTQAESGDTGSVAIFSDEISNEPVRVSRARQYRIDLHVAHGSITELDTRAIVVGVFNDITPTGAARAIDDALDGSISEIIQRRMFGANRGEVFMFPVNRRRIPTETVILLGLGQFNTFDPEAQRLATEHLVRTLTASKISEFGIVLIGGGFGRDVRSTLQTMVEGFIHGASDYIGTRSRDGIRTITLCEYNKQRFEEIYAAALSLTMTPLLDDIEITVVRETLPAAPTRSATRSSGSTPRGTVSKRLDPGPKANTRVTHSNGWVR